MAKLIKNSLGNFLVILVIFSLVMGWFFSGWPRIWEKPQIPPEVQETRAQAPDIREFIILTASTTWTVPNDWNYASNTIEVIGGGGGGRSGTNGCTGGGGGAYAKISNLTLTPGNTVTLQVGSGGGAEVSGGDTWFDDTTATTTTCDDQSVCAKAGATGSSDTTAGLRGASSTSIGDPKFAGGAGGGSTNADPCGGGGGTGGPHGEGADGGAGHTSATNGAGGGGGGGGGGTLGQAGSASTPYGGAGGNNWQGSGGAATSSSVGNVGTLGGGGGGGADTYSGGDAGNGTDWSSSPAYGAGGGGGGAGDPDDSTDIGGKGGTYGAGGGGGGTGGSGAQGIIVIAYTPATVPDAPTNLATTTVGNAQVDLSWTAPASDGGSVILYYEIFRDTYSSASTSLATTTATTYSDTSVVNGTTYYYNVKAVNAVGSSSASNEVSATPEAPSSTISCSTNISSTTFETLSSSATTTASPNSSTTMSCSGTAFGCTLYVKDAGNTASSGLATTSPPYLIPSPNIANTASTTLAAGTEGYGIQATTTSAGLTIDPVYNQTGDIVGGLSLSDLTIASSTADITNAEVIVTHMAAISEATSIGIYEDTITYSCLINDAPAWACGDSVDFTYNGGPVTYGTVASASSTCWLNRNLGASGVAASSIDYAGYGDYFQWGREDDGHQASTSSSVEGDMTLTAQPGDANFITEQTPPYDWATTTWITRWTVAEDDPCPAGWRVPTNTEWDTERLSWSSNDDVGAFASPLKLPLAGGRDYYDGSLDDVGSYGYYWSSTVISTYAYRLFFYSGDAYMFNVNRAYGFSVRCLKD